MKILTKLLQFFRDNNDDEKNNETKSIFDINVFLIEKKQQNHEIANLKNLVIKIQLTLKLKTKKTNNLISACTQKIQKSRI